MTLNDIIPELFQLADNFPVDPMKEFGKPLHKRHRRDIRFQGLSIRIQLTRTIIGNEQFYQLSIGPNRYLPEKIIQEIRQAFFYNRENVEFPSVMGNCRQFLAETD